MTNRAAVSVCCKRVLVNGELITQSLLIFLSQTLVITIKLNLKFCTNLTCILIFYHGSYFVHTQQSDKCAIVEQQKLHLRVAGT